MALSCVVSEIFNVEEYRDLEIPVRVNQGHWKWYHSIDWLWSQIFLTPVYFVPKLMGFPLMISSTIWIQCTNMADRQTD